MSNSNTTVTSPDRDRHPTVLEVKAAEMDLPRVIWEEGAYRIVLIYNVEEDTIERIIERQNGFDAMGQQKWQSLGPRRGDKVPADWQYIACQLAVYAAPWPSLEMPTPENRGLAAQTRALSADKIVAAENALLDAYNNANSAYRISDNAAVDARLLETVRAVKKLAEVLGLDPFREPAGEPLSALQGDT